MTWRAWVRKRKHVYCSKDCKNAHHSELYGSNISSKDYYRNYYRKNKERIAALAKIRNQANRAEKSEYDRNRREEFGNKIRAYDKDRYYKIRRGSVNVMFCAARARAKAKGLPFSITRNDIDIPDICPALGIPLFTRDGSGTCDNSASLDRIIPSLGYVPGNVIVISMKANAIKHNATASEIIAVGNWLSEITKAQPKPL